MTSSHALGISTRLTGVRSTSKRVSPSERLGVLLLPSRVEAFRFADHARALLAIPRVIALEPGRFATPRFLRDALSLRQAKRLRFPGQPRLLVVYHPTQYPLARALSRRYEDTELWYLRGLGDAVDGELGELDQLAQERAVRVHDVAQGGDLAVAEEELRLRLSELDIISHRPFFPGGRISPR